MRDLPHRPFKTLEMRIVVDEIPVQDADTFIDSVREQKPTVHDRDLRLFGRQERAIQENRHGTWKPRSSQTLSPSKPRGPGV